MTCFCGVQGRARPSLDKLYNWRYQALGDLPAVTQQERFRRANPGLAFDYQFIGELVLSQAVPVAGRRQMLQTSSVPQPCLVNVYCKQCLI